MDRDTRHTKRRRYALSALAVAVLLALAGAGWFFMTRPGDPFAASRSAEEEAQLIEAGEDLYLRLNCISCHGNEGEGIKGPSLAGIVGEQVELVDGQTVERDHRYLRRALSKPGAEVVAGYDFVPMPSYDELEEAQVVALLLYLRSLGEISDSME